jgi:hypothetical protein
MEPTVCTRSLQLARLAAIALFATLMTGCSILFPPLDCPDLDQVCPDLECDTFATAAGCDICECADDPEPEPTVCWDSSDCAGGQLCNTADFCETPPGCEDGQPCPDVCYGRCVDPPVECFSDGDCGENEFCRVGGGDPRPAAPCAEDDPDCGGNDFIAPSGICVPVGCEENFDFPACPPGTVPDVDFSEDECGNPVCRPVDDCRSRSVDECESLPGCRLEELPSPCDCEPTEPNGACACPVELVCAPNEECRDLGPEECDANPNCEGRFLPPPGDCFEECNANGECFIACPEEDPAIAPPEGEFVCAPRFVPESCRGDFDCRPDQRCERTVRCDDANCFETPDGQVICEEQCEDFGTCVDVGSSCFDLGPEACVEDPRCRLTDNGGAFPEPPPCECDPNDPDCVCATDPLPPPVCEPIPPEGCLEDSQCRDGERCDLTTTCPPCTGEGDPGCLAPCFVEGVCVPAPTTCETDDQCGPGARCDVREICPPCAQPDPDDPNAPIACECFIEGQCVPTDSFCFSDFDCANDQFCDFVDPFCGPPSPNGLIACAGVCTDREVPPGVCLENSDCDPGFRCATELDVCVCPEGDPDCQLSGVCFSQCVPTDNGDSCFETADCAEGLVCDLENFCDPPPDCPQCTVCAGRCVDPGDPTEGFCRNDDECGAGQHCGFEFVECTRPPGTLTNECWSICVDDSPSSRLCLEDTDCPETQRCATEQDICYCPDNTTCEVCFSECVER